MMNRSLTLLPERFAIVKLPPNAEFPAWAKNEIFCSITRTTDELSVVTFQANVPTDVVANRGWRAFTLQGPIDFAEVGVLHSLTAPLADAGVSIFAVSTYDTDYVLVKEEAMERAVKTLRDSGCQIFGDKSQLSER